MYTKYLAFAVISIVTVLFYELSIKTAFSERRENVIYLTSMGKISDSNISLAEKDS
jgi:hypothetical protein